MGTGAARGRTMVRVVIVLGYVVLMLLVLVGGLSLSRPDDASRGGRAPLGGVAVPG